MLTELIVRNLALAEDVAISLGAGFSVLTGETGAGKSMVVGALTLLLGGRSSAEQIRAGSETAFVEGIFDVSELPEVATALADMDLDDDGTELILSREISRSGKTRCRANGHSVSVSQVRQLGSILVDVCGQHENQSLFNAGRQLAFLDRLGGAELWNTRLRLLSLHAKLVAATAERARLVSDSREVARRVDLLEYQLNEILSSGVASMNEDALRQEKSVLSNADRLLTETGRVHDLLLEPGPSGASIIDEVGRGVHTMQGLARLDPSLEGVSSALTSAHDILRESARDLRQYRDGVDSDASRLGQIEEALDSLSGLKRKYGESVTEIVAYANSAAAELAAVSHRGEVIDGLAEQIRGLKQEYLINAERASALRAETACRVSALLDIELRDLGMPSSSFEMRVYPGASAGGELVALEPNEEGTNYSPTGLDTVEFLLSANVGEDAKPLARVASGGELSRVLLALKTVMGRFDHTPTMVFDEIDAGIGGLTATAVAAKLAAISLGSQVICVTHLAQLAYMGDHHYSIRKSTADGRTRTEVVALHPEERVHEIARMLGSESTEKTLGHVREMLANAAESKTSMEIGGNRLT